jgi:hypothetical protein
MAAYGRQPRLVEAAVEKRWLVHPVRLRCRSAGPGGGVELGTEPVVLNRFVLRFFVIGL